MCRTTRILICVTTLACLVGSSSYGALPTVISYQGLLTLDDGTVLHHDTETFELRFRIFDSATDGDLKFEQTLVVLVRDGVYNVLLSDAGLESVFTEPSRFMEVTVLAGPGIASPIVLAPRQQIASVPYALVAGSGSGVGPQGPPGPEGPPGVQQSAACVDGRADDTSCFPVPSCTCANGIVRPVQSTPCIVWTDSGYGCAAVSNYTGPPLYLECTGSCCVCGEN